MDPAEAAFEVLQEADADGMHWTVIWDRALRARLIDPLAQPGAREELLRALAAAAREGRVVKTSTGTYRLP